MFAVAYWLVSLARIGLNRVSRRNEKRNLSGLVCAAGVSPYRGIPVGLSRSITTPLASMGILLALTCRLTAVAYGRSNVGQTLSTVAIALNVTAHGSIEPSGIFHPPPTFSASGHVAG